MASMNRQVTTPVKFPRSKRNHPVPVITSCDPGVCAPVAAIPMFREDAIVGRKNKKTMQWQSSRIQFAIEMKETKEIIVNKVRARVTAYCVPWLAMERFKGAREEFERSYAGEESLSGDGVVPFFESAAWPAVGTSEFYDTLGMHSTTGGNVNTMYLEAYNAIWNFRAKNRAKDIPLRTRLDDTLAPAFWPANRFEHLVPDFDEAVMDGQVALNVLYDQLPVRGIGFSSGSPTLDSGTIRHGDGLVDTLTGDRWVQGAGSNALVMDTTGAAPNVFPDIFAELQSNGISISLANIEMAKKAQKFAKLREQFTGHTDDWLIDNHLMNGLTLPDQAMKQPFLVADETELLGINDRAQLAVAEEVMRERVRRAWLTAGVTMLHPPTTFIDDTVTLAPDAVLEQGVVLRGATHVGGGARVGAYSVLTDAHVAEGERVPPHTLRDA